MIRIAALVLMLFVSTAYGQTEGDIVDHPVCKYCNMDRQRYDHSRMLVEYGDGTVFGSCSLHCMALDLILNIDREIRAIYVGDYKTHRLIDAETAFWVIGGSRPGVMTRRAKWAFAEKKEALRYERENGGRLARFDEAMKAAYEDMYADTKMIRSKRKIRKMWP
ncbi:MAG: nitrous oxide reductase accessory protein NosL [Acidobacteriota bacterium]